MKIFKYFLLLTASFIILGLLATLKVPTAKADCPPPDALPFHITATASGKRVNFTIDPAPGHDPVLGDAHMDIRGLGGHVYDLTIPPGTTSFPVTFDLPDDFYAAKMFISVCDISNTASFRIPGTGGGGGECPVTMPFVLGSPTITGNSATFSISPAPGPGAKLGLHRLGGINTLIDIPKDATSISWTGADGAYTAVMVYTICEVSNTVSFGLPGFIGGIGGAGDCGDFFACVGDIAAPGLSTTKFHDRTIVTDVLTIVLPLTITLGGFLSVIVIVVSGIQFITSSGNPEGAAAARGRLVFAIIGFVVLVLAFAALRIVDILILGGSGLLNR